jgi:hypothetical protein
MPRFTGPKKHAQSSPSGPRYTSNIELSGQGVAQAGERFIRLSIDAPDHPRPVQTIERIDNLASRSAFDAMCDRLNKLNAHLITSQARNELLGRIQSLGAQKPTFSVVTTVGWTGNMFVRPDGCIGKSSLPTEVYLSEIKSELLSKYRASGNLKAWIEIPDLARGNTRLMLALSLAAVGPIGDVLDVEQVGVQLFGKAASGKTSVSKAASSFWGMHCQRARASSHGFGETWNHTLNNLEPVAVAHNHAFLLLDETRVASSGQNQPRVDVIVDAVMRLEKSTEKGRLNTQDDQRSWWVPVLSTSNLSLDDLAKQGKFALDDAHRGRLIDVPMPHDSNIYEDLHGFSDKSAFSKYLFNIAQQHHGLASIKFLRRLVEWRVRDQADLVEWLECRREHYLSRARNLNCGDRDLTRIHGKFATIYAAGRLGIKFGLFPWRNGELCDALLQCEQAHIDHVMKYLPQNQEVDTVDKFRDILRESRPGFVDLRKGLLGSSENPNDFVGFISQHQGKNEFLFTEQQLGMIVKGLVSTHRLKETLHAAGFLRVTRGGAQGLRFVVKRLLVQKCDRQYVVAVRAAILDNA